MILSYFALFIAVFCTALGQFFYKTYSIVKKKKYYYRAIFLFILTPFFNFVALRNISIDIVYISTSITILLVVLLSKYFLNEHIKKRTYYGILFIVLGVIVYAY